MHGGVRRLDDVFRRLRGRSLKGGSTVVGQTHGRNGSTTPPAEDCHQGGLGYAGR